MGTSTPSVAWPRHRLDMRVQREARAWLRARAKRAAIGITVLAVLSIPLILAPFFFLAAAALQYMIASSLAKNGSFVPAVLIDPVRGPASFETAAEAFDADMQPPVQGGGSSTLILIELVYTAVKAFTAMIARFAPAMIVHHRFRIGTKERTCGKYMFGDEHFYTDTKGWHWALVHPKHPRLMHWPVCTRGPLPSSLRPGQSERRAA